MSVKVNALDHIVINVADVARSAKWYATILGMEIRVFDPGPGKAKRTSLVFGNQKINVRPRNADTVENSHATGSVSGPNLVGGLVGMNYGTVSNSHWNTDVTATGIGFNYGSTTGTTGLSTAQMAQVLNLSEAEVSRQLDQLKKDGVLLGWRPVLNLSDEDAGTVRAVIEVRITPERGGGFNRLAERISRFDEVESCYLMSGGYDLLVFVGGVSAPAA